MNIPLELLDLLTSPRIDSRSLVDLLESEHGFVFIGSGMEARVFGNTELDFVIKIYKRMHSFGSISFSNIKRAWETMVVRVMDNPPPCAAETYPILPSEGDECLIAVQERLVEGYVDEYVGRMSKVYTHRKNRGKTYWGDIMYFNCGINSEGKTRCLDWITYQDS